MGDQQQAGLLTALHLVELPVVVDNVVEQAHAGLQQLSSSLPSLSDEERKRALLRYLHGSRQQLQRLHVAVAWSNKAKAVAEVKRLLEVASSHTSALRDAADQVAYLWGELEDGKAPLYDVPTAVQVLESGAYKLLPSTIEEQAAIPPPAASEARRRAALLRMDFLLRSKLLAATLPEGMEVARVRGGTAEVAAPGEYLAELTLVPAPRDQVTLAKYRPAGEEADAPKVLTAGLAAAAEVTQTLKVEAGAAAAAAAAAGDTISQEVQGTAASSEGGATNGGAAGEAAAAAGTGGSLLAGSAQQGGSTALREADRWRWLLVSFKLLPEWESDMAAMAPNQAAWLQRHLEDKMWRAADAQQLQRLGVARSLLHFPQLPARSQQAKQAAAPTPAATPQGPAASQLSSPPSGSAEPGPATTAAAAAREGPSGAVADGHGPAAAPVAAAPDWATCPLSLLHSVLRQAAGRLTLYSLVLTEARRLEKGPWEGLLRISRAGGSALRFTYWLGRPLVSHRELLSLRSSAAATAGSAAARPAGAGGGQPGAAPAPPAALVAPAVDVSLEESGALECLHTPSLLSPLSGQPVQLRLSPVSLSIEQLLLSAAAHNAATQLAAVQAVVESDSLWPALGLSLQLVPPSVQQPHSPLVAASDSQSGAAAVPTAAEAGEGPLLLCRAAGEPSPFLALSLALKTARLTLTAGPALLESWGEPGGALSSSDPVQGSLAAGAALGSLVSAAQQRLERAQQDALTLPLAAAPASVLALVQQSGSRGLLAVGLVAAEVAALCQRLVRRRRLAQVATAARRLGLSAGLCVPLSLLEGYFSRQPVARAAPLASDALTLALPSFPAPPDMVCWETRQRARREAAVRTAEAIRQHRQRIKQVAGGSAALPAAAGLASAAAGGGALPPFAAGLRPAAPATGTTGAAGPAAAAGVAARDGGRDCGAVRAHLLVEWQDAGQGGEEEAGQAVAAEPGGAAALQQRQQPPLGAQSGQAGPGLRLGLVLKVLPLPSHLLSAATHPAAQPKPSEAAPGPAAPGPAVGPKRRRSEAELDELESLPKRGTAAEAGARLGEAQQAQQQQQQRNGQMGAPVAPQQRPAVGAAAAAGDLRPLLQSAVQWCQEAAVWEQMVVQLRALRIPFTEEWQLAPRATVAPPPPSGLCRAGSLCQGGSSPGVCRRVLRLPCPPALAAQDAWAAQQRRSASMEPAAPDDSTGRTECSVAAAAAAVTGGLPGTPAGLGAKGRAPTWGPQVLLQMEACCLAAGTWQAHISSGYLSQLPQLYSRYGVRLAGGGGSSAAAAVCQDEAGEQGDPARGPVGGAGAAAAVAAERPLEGPAGLELTAAGVLARYEQRRGDSALTVVSDVLCMLRLHACCARLVSLMLAHPLGPHRHVSGSTQHQPNTAGQTQQQPIRQQQLPEQQHQVPRINGALELHPAVTDAAAGKGSKAAGAVKRNSNSMWVELESLTGADNDSGQLANGFYLDPLEPAGRGEPAGVSVPAQPQQQHQQEQQPQQPRNGAMNGSSSLHSGEAKGLPGSPAMAGGASEGVEGPPQAIKAAAGAAAAPAEPTLLWVVPLCASVALAEVGLTRAVLLVQPSLPPGAGLHPQHPQQRPLGSQQQVGAQLRLTIEWVGQYSTHRGGGSSSTGPGRPVAPTAAAASEAPGTDAGGGSGLVTCRVSAEPQLPAPTLQALAAQLDAGCEAEFLDSLCLAAAPWAALCQAVAPTALRAAGLLCGSIKLSSTGTNASRSALRLALHAQHGQRTLLLHLEAGRGGYTLLRLMGSRGAAYPAWAEAAWASVCQLPVCHAAAEGAAALMQAKQAWCGLGSLGTAVGILLRALAAGDSGGALQQ
ncbi:hypothetical protein N2152v2_001354 [Parachlorella kessleri]